MKILKKSLSVHNHSNESFGNVFDGVYLRN